MKHYLLIVSFFIFTLINQVNFACDVTGKSGIVPENKLYIPIGLKGVTSISESQYNKVIDRIESLYSKKISALGGKLVFNKDWIDGTVNAYAHRDHLDGKYWFVTILGGIARHSQMNEDGLAAVACHELGHHLGGFPKNIASTKSSKKWVSSEGQADYYSALKCLRFYFAGMNNIVFVNELEVPTEVTSACQKSFINAEEIAICQRSAMAGLTLGKFFRALSEGTEQVNFFTPDKTKINQTYESHPSAQCRLDTIYQASICDKSINEDVSDTDGNIGACTAKNGDTIGLRPTCWFQPNTL